MNKSRVKAKSKPDNPAWWLEDKLAANAAGLSCTEALSRLSKFGPNLFRNQQKQLLFLQFFARFKLTMVFIKAR
jgi:Mg2+-importing ATPase